MQPDKLEALWSEPKNWNGFCYNCKEDPRLIVPKRVKALGWTINCAHAATIPVSIFIFACAIGPSIGLAIFERPLNPIHLLISVLLSAGTVILLCIVLSRPRSS